MLSKGLFAGFIVFKNIVIVNTEDVLSSLFTTSSHDGNPQLHLREVFERIFV